MIFPPASAVVASCRRGLCARRRAAGFTLLELTMVLALLVIITWFVVPNFRDPLKRTHLPESAEQFRSLLALTRARAMIDGLRYRIRFLEEDEEAAANLTLRERLQPIVEVESDPIEYPDEFTPVTAPWAQAHPFVGDVWCYQIRYGEPTYESVLAELEQQDYELEEEEQLKRELGLEPDQRWLLLFEPDGTSEWMTFRLVDVPYEEFQESDRDLYPQLDVILDGRLGMIFLQRPLSEDEIDILLDKGHSPILRRDFLITRELTEDDVLEIDMSGRS